MYPDIPKIMSAYMDKPTQADTISEKITKILKGLDMNKYFTYAVIGIIGYIVIKKVI